MKMSVRTLKSGKWHFAQHDSRQGLAPALASFASKVPSDQVAIPLAGEVLDTPAANHNKKRMDELRAQSSNSSGNSSLFYIDHSA
jgi:hypothetical protein